MNISPDKAAYDFFSKPLLTAFDKQLQELKPIGCTYLYYAFIYDTHRKSVYSANDWRHAYQAEALGTDDPLKRLAEEYSPIVAPWNDITFNDKNEKKVMQARDSYDLRNGITLSRKINDGISILVLATDSQEHDLARYVIHEKSAQVNSAFEELTKLAVRDYVQTQKELIFQKTLSDANILVRH